jgi:NAD(P)-dependent dehydrogenase (short-subunit alcohol dehydrogenase family)
VEPWRYFECVLKTNVMGPALVTEEAVPHMRPGGVVIHVGSSMASAPTPNALAYGASKAAVEHLVASQAVRYASRRIRVVGLAPGGLHTDASRGLSSLQAAAETLVFLASPYGAHFQGTTLRMDSGEIVKNYGPGRGGARR